MALALASSAALLGSWEVGTWPGRSPGVGEELLDTARGSREPG